MSSTTSVNHIRSYRHYRTNSVVHGACFWPPHLFFAMAGVLWACLGPPQTVLRHGVTKTIQGHGPTVRYPGPASGHLICSSPYVQVYGVTAPSRYGWTRKYTRHKTTQRYKDRYEVATSRDSTRRTLGRHQTRHISSSAFICASSPPLLSGLNHFLRIL